jgi:ATP/maltotriose-dependent transcriptional regulator MalT
LDELTIRLLLSVVVEVLPPGMRVYLASRSLHQVSVANLKAKQILLELNMESLRFVPAETEHYLHQANLFLSDEHLRWLHHAVKVTGDGGIAGAGVEAHTGQCRQPPA